MFDLVKSFLLFLMILINYRTIETNTTLSRYISRSRYCTSSIISFTCKSDLVELDIKQEFVEYSDSHNTDIPIVNFEWSASIVNGEIPEQAFNRVKLLNIRLNSVNLEKIHSNAFSKVPGIQITNVWNHSGKESTKLRNFANTDYDIYEAFMSMTALNSLTINLDWDSAHEIPNNPFASNKWSRLTQIVFNGQFVISRIGIHLIFHLQNIFNEISFEGVFIKMISKNAFQIQNNCLNCDILNIILISTQLNENSLETGVFNINGRAVHLHLENNNFEVLREEIFSDFLLNNENNFLYLNENPLNCDSQQKPLFDWILTKSEYKKRVFANCVQNGKSIWDFDWNSSTSSSSPSVGPPTSSPPSTAFCNENGEYDGQYGVSKWPSVAPGYYSIVNCSNARGVIRWLCLDNAKFDEKGPEMEECWLDDLADLDLESVEDVEQTLEIIIENTKNESSLHSFSSLEKVLKIVIKCEDFLQNLETIESLIAQQIGNSFVQVFSQTIDQSIAWSDGKGRERVKTASKLLLFIQKTGFTTNCYLNSDNNTKEFFSRNLYEKLFFNLTQNLFFEFNSYSVFVPKEAFQDIHDQDGHSCQRKSSLGAVINKLSEYLTQEKRENLEINSELIAFSLRNEQKIQLKEGVFVKIKLKHKNTLSLGDKMECLFWDYSQLQWSTKGCSLVKEESNREESVCLCNHLTNFAAIMDLSGRERDEHSKHVLTLFFCSLSSLSLLINIFLILKKEKVLKKFKKNYKKVKNENQITRQLMKKRDLIVVNESACLLIANLIVMIGMDRTRDQVLCHVSSFLLLYFLLGTFVWMLQHAIHLFRMTHNVFLTDYTQNYLFLLIGYCTPLLISVVGLFSASVSTGSFSRALLGSDYFCWISSPKYPSNVWILIGPALIVIVINVSIIAYLLHRVHTIHTKSNFRQILGFLCLVLNLGITWSLFVSYMNRVTEWPRVFSYLFIVVNGSQGLFVLIYQLIIYFL